MDTPNNDQVQAPIRHCWNIYSAETQQKIHEAFQRANTKALQSIQEVGCIQQAHERRDLLRGVTILGGLGLLGAALVVRHTANATTAMLP